MYSEMVKPPKLQPGDRVATVSLSWGGPGTFLHRYEAGKRQLQDEFGLVVVEMPHTLREATWLADHPRARADDLMRAFADPSIKAIISTIGGDDSIRILPYLDLGTIRSNPKVFLGYSDTTISHMACLKAGLVSFYGPAIMAGFAENGGLFSYMVNSVRQTLFSSAPIGEIPPNSDGWTVEILDWAEPENQSRRRKLNPSQGWKLLLGRGCLAWASDRRLLRGSGLAAGHRLLAGAGSLAECHPVPGDIRRSPVSIRGVARSSILCCDGYP